jgi:uncharacterized protein (DUF433 family)
MATARYRIVSGADSEIHDEPHLPASRLTVRDIHARVEERGCSPATVANRFSLDIAAVYEALAYYHANPETMRAVDQRHEQAVDAAREQSSLQPPDAEQ